jgi:hypothetical protein
VHKYVTFSKQPSLFKLNINNKKISFAAPEPRAADAATAVLPANK